MKLSDCVCTVIVWRRQRTKTIDTFHRLCSFPCPPLKCVRSVPDVLACVLPCVCVCSWGMGALCFAVGCKYEPTAMRWYIVRVLVLIVVFTLGGGWKSSQGTCRWRQFPHGTNWWTVNWRWISSSSIWFKGRSFHSIHFFVLRIDNGFGATIDSTCNVIRTTTPAVIAMM